MWRASLSVRLVFISLLSNDSCSRAAPRKTMEQEGAVIGFSLVYCYSSGERASCYFDFDLS